MSFFEPWQQYKTPCVRQLAFCIASPNIISSIPSELPIKYSFQLHDHIFWQTQFLQYQTRLNELDRDPTDLLLFIAQLKSTRLGLRFERFLLFWLCDDKYHNFQLIGHSIQQIQGKSTLGELDFVIFNRVTRQIEHWEVAIKYYLAESSSSLEQWYGLNRNDTLVRKLHHFTQKQFQFNTLDEKPIMQKYAVLKGQLYYPINQPFLKSPNWICTLRRTGFWGHTIITPLYRLTRQEWITTNLQPAQPAQWWHNGLYCNQDQNFFYMYRHSLRPILYK
ncbi:DUF1853 family protein [Acinetobacter boissieri]|uniref:DUF1853 domain-containing protein n=1 Tax=Acinetobacter boissieri TaxID=1219383 RepID=A0A1G6HCZ0_9GAMM|nr:DUF1853 family protein [Acinetobacter boissieri]SDB92023.1 hypothetical protein SAMN05421733_10520 [Acinetobacter boissieri]